MAYNSAELSVKQYTQDRKVPWDTFLDEAKNSTFLFCRDYMDYHSDRFTDYSLMIYHGDRLAALLPANIKPHGTLISHEGLTYGGLVVRRSARLCDVLTCFRACLQYLHERHIPRLLYKRIPSFYNTIPDDEVPYALHLLEARLYRRDCAIVVPLGNRLPLQKRRRRQITKAMRRNVHVVQNKDFRPFWEQVLVPRLVERYGVRPVHTAEEITLLASRFPQQIKQFNVYCGSEILAGTIIYETPSVAHAQYIAAVDEGQRTGALDFLFAWLIDDFYKGKRFMDFGISNEDEGQTLNHGLLDWKEGFGGRTYCHDFYEVTCANYVNLDRAICRPLKHG